MVIEMNDLIDHSEKLMLNVDDIVSFRIKMKELEMGKILDMKKIFFLME